MDAPSSVPKPARRYRSWVFQVYLVAAALLFATLFFFARTVPYFPFDLAITRSVQAISLGGFDTLMVWVSAPGYTPQSYLWCGAIIVGLFVRGWRWEAGMGTFAAVGITLVGLVVKWIVQRPRPASDLIRVAGPINSSSFPSGHVLFYTAFLGFLLFLLYTQAPRSWWRATGMLLAGTLIVLIGVSRVYLGQHWFSDVLGAYLLGSLWLALTIYVYRVGKGKKWFAR